MTQPKLFIEIDGSVVPLQNALKKAEKSTEDTGRKIKQETSKIDDAFKATGGKVQEAFGPLGKLLGPTGLALGAVGLAAGVVAGALGKMFEVVKSGNEAMSKLGAFAKASSDQIRDLKTSAEAAESAFTRLSASLGVLFAPVTKSVSGGVDTLADFALYLAGGLSAGDERMGAEAFAQGQRRQRGKRAPAVQSILDQEKKAQEQAREALVERRARMDKDEERRLQRAAAAKKERDRMLDIFASPERMMGGTLDVIASDEEFRRNLEEADLALGESNTKLAEDARRKRLEAARLRRQQETARSRAEKAREAARMSQFEDIATAGAFGLAGVLSTGLRGGNVGTSVGAAITSVASTAATAVLGPIGGAIVGGVIDGLIGSIFESEEQQVEAQARARALEMRRQRWLQRNREAAGRRLQNLPEMTLARNGSNATIVQNFNFSGVVGGSPRRLARELADVMGSG